jgi:hypothetical protein
MVAATAAVRSMLQRMSLSLEAASEVTAVTRQNLSDSEDFLQLKDKDIETLCRVIHQPGGINAAGNVNQGISVLAMAEANMKRMIYQLHHVIRCSRPFVWADITLVSVRRLVAQAEMEASHKDPVSLPIMDPKSWPKNFEAINEFFQAYRGIQGHPAMYVYCTELLPAAAGLDPAADVVGSAYFTQDDELIARGPILEMGAAVGPNAETVGPFTNAFLVDRAAVWKKLARFSSLATPSQSSSLRTQAKMKG